jgi:DNA-binding MarR family transcriptional regulator
MRAQAEVPSALRADTPQSILPKHALLSSQLSSTRIFQWTLVAGQVRWRELMRIRIVSGSVMNAGRELPRLLRAAYFGMHRVSDAHFSRYGVTADQFVLLVCLAEQDALTQLELARRASSDPSTIRAMLVLLEGRGLVARDRHPDDSRARVVTLTAKGRRLAEHLWKTSEPIRMQMLSGFSADEAHLLVGCLRRLIDNLAVAKARRGPKQAKPVPGSGAQSGN